MKTLIKKSLGRVLVGIGNTLPAAKTILKPLGMRVPEGSGDMPVRVQTPDRQTLILTNIDSNYLSFQVFWKGTAYYEPITTSVILSLVHPGTTFVDVGANIGFFSLMVSLSKPGTEVVAFEPNPKNFKILSQNVSVNRFENIRCEPAAVSNATGTASLYLSKSDMSASLRQDFQKNSNPVAECVQVETISLDDYLLKHPLKGPLILKIDVEGHEMALLEGAKQVLEKYSPDLIMEVLKPYSEEMTDSFRKLGYRFYSICDKGLVQSPTIVPLERKGLCFLNYLISKRPVSELERVSLEAATLARRMDLRKTSKYFGPESKPFESMTASIVMMQGLVPWAELANTTSVYV